MIRFDIFFHSVNYSDNPDSKKITTEIIIPVLSSPEIVLIGHE